MRSALVAANLRLIRERWKHDLAGRPSLAEVGDLPPMVLRDLTASARIFLAGSNDRRTAELASILSTELPDGRLAVLGLPGPRQPRSVERISDRDVESVLSERRFAFDVIVLDARAAAEHEAVLTATQPQAQVLLDDGEVGLEDALAAAGAA